MESQFNIDLGGGVLQPDFPKELISIYGYNWIGIDRNRHGGGIGFYIRDTLNYRVRSDLNNTDIEVLTIEISKYKTKPFLVTTWYRPPNTSIEKFQEFEKLLQYIDLEDKESIILGDLNCDLISEFTNDSNTNELKFVTNMYQYKQLQLESQEIQNPLLIIFSQTNQKTLYLQEFPK